MWRDNCYHCGAPIWVARPVTLPPPRVQSVLGVSEADCVRQAEGDVLQARANGYAPVGQAWSEEAGLVVLTVTYEYAGAGS
jgi:hypothetical protein